MILRDLKLVLCRSVIPSATNFTGFLSLFDIYASLEPDSAISKLSFSIPPLTHKTKNTIVHIHYPHMSPHSMADDPMEVHRVDENKVSHNEPTIQPKGQGNHDQPLDDEMNQNLATSDHSTSPEPKQEQLVEDRTDCEVKRYANSSCFSGPSLISI